MKALKIILGLFTALVVVVAIVVYVGLKNIDSIVKNVVEEVGPKVIGTEVSLSDVKITLAEGRAELFGLSIANPEGFSNADAFSLGQVAVELDLGSLGKDVLVINEVLISDIQLLAEQTGMKDINLQTLLNNLKSGSGTSSSSTPQPSESSASDFKMAVKKFTFAGGNIHLTSEQLGEKDLKLPTIALKDLGSASNGLTPDQLATAAMEPLLNQAKESVQDYAEAEAKEKAREKIEEKLSEKLDKDDMDKLKSLFKK